MYENCEDLWQGHIGYIKMIRYVRPARSKTSPHGRTMIREDLYFNDRFISDLTEKEFILKCRDKNPEKFLLVEAHEIEV